MSGEKELKPCPFCGVTPILIEEPWPNRPDVASHPHNSCIIAGESVDVGDWNRRATPPGFERVPEGTMAEEMAKAFHSAYEGLAPSHGYETRIVYTRTAWENVPQNQKALMIETCGAVLLWMRHRAAQKGGEAEAPDYKALYHELLYQVSIKHPGETRHQTALRYLKNAENQNNTPHQAKETPNAQGAPQ